MVCVKYFELNWGRSKASITALWEEGRYSEFCAQDDGSPVTALDVLQVVDYVVPRSGRYVMHECLTKDTILFRVKATRVR